MEGGRSAERKGERRRGQNTVRSRHKGEGRMKRNGESEGWEEGRERGGNPAGQ